MKVKRLEDVKENEVLAKSVMTADYKVILSEGTVIRKEYLKKLMELGIREITVKEEEPSNEVVILKTEIEETIREKVKDILERHTYHHNNELSELSQTADKIIDNILEEKEVVKQVFDIKERSADIYEHSINTCSIAILVALKMGLKEQQVHDIGVGCLLHDIGLRYMTLNFSNKELLELDRKEIAEYKKHPIYGYSSLKDEEWISELSKSIILSHHEKLDGSGYPLHIRDISLEIKIVSVCDTFDEMICGIGCERSKVYEAIEYLKVYREQMFDKNVVDCLLTFVAVYPAGSHVMTNDGCCAIVISQNKDFPDRPLIRILKDKDGNDVRKYNQMINLMEVHNLFIEKTLD